MSVHSSSDVLSPVIQVRRESGPRQFCCEGVEGGKGGERGEIARKRERGETERRRQS